MVGNPEDRFSQNEAHFISCAQNSLVELSISTTQSGWLSGIRSHLFDHTVLSGALVYGSIQF